MDRAAYGAVVLAGGAGRRMGDPRKPIMAVSGRTMLDRVLDAVSDADPRVVVGPPDLPVPAGVLLTRERPVGAGPVAATAAGVALAPDGLPHVALLAADLPLLDRPAVAVLRASVGDADVAVYLDAEGRRQTLCGVWRTAALRRALATLAAQRGSPDASAAPHAGVPLAAAGALDASAAADVGVPLALVGAPMRALLDAVRIVEVSWTGAGPPPWFDCDTDADLRQAEEWAR